MLILVTSNMHLKGIELKPEIIFIILGFIFGISFLLINPQNEVADEPTHFGKALELSKGQIYLGKSTIFIDLYSPVPYLIPAFALFLGKLLNISNFIIYYLGRLANLILFIFIVYLAIKFTPVLKWAFLLLGLMPMTLYEAASYSSDGFNIAITFLLIALIFKFAFDDEIQQINQKNMLKILLLGLLLALAKQVYVLVLFSFFLIPSTKFESQRKLFINFVSILLTCFLAIIGWHLLIHGVYYPISPQVSVYGQMMFILHNPIEFIFIYMNTLVQNFSYYSITFIGTFGWNNIGLDTPLPDIIVYAYIMVLILASLTDNSKIKIELNKKLISLITFIITITAIFTTEYFMWTVVGANKIDGVYGRYFIPIAPLLFLIFYNNHFKQIKWKNLTIIIFILIILLISTILIFMRFY